MQTVNPRLKPLWASCYVALFSLMWASQSRADPSSETRTLAQASCFDVMAWQGSVHVLFGQTSGPEGEDLTFHHIRSDTFGRTWSAPVAVPSSHARPGQHHRGNDPQLAVYGDRVLAVWTAQGAGPFGSGPLGASLSLDGGATWKPIPVPQVSQGHHEAGYRFPALAADANGFHVIWIHAAGAERSLRYSRFRLEQQAWSEPTVIDPQICACCWNRLATTEDGRLVALYRDIAPSDMGVATSEDGGTSWQLQNPAGDFDWFFQGCPHVGGGLSVTLPGEKRMNILTSIWTGHSDRAGAHAFTSADQGANWISPQWASGPPRKGRATDVTSRPDGWALMVWDQPDGDGSAVFGAISKDGGLHWQKAERMSPKGRPGTYPRAINTAQGFWVFWTQTRAEEQPSIMVRNVRFDPSWSGK